MRDSITREELLALISDRVREGRHIEYKRDRIEGTDTAKKEFLRDVVAFANAAGGTIFLGIDEERDSGGKPTGVPREVVGVSIENVDAEVRRLTDIIRTGIEPVLSGVQISSVDGFSAGSVLLVRIPRSHRAPHMVTFQSSPRFYSRVSTGRHPLDIEEIRDAFLRAEDLPARIRAFRGQRVQVLQHGETPVPMDSGPLLIVHIVPVDTFSDHRAIAFSDILHVGRKMRLVGFSSLNHAINLDGHLSWAPAKDGGPRRAVGYLQVFRDGSLEAVDGLEIPPNNSQEDSVSPTRLEALVVKQVLDYAKEVDSLPVGDELAIMVTLLNAKGRSIALRDCDEACVVDRSVVLVPDLLIAREELTQPAALKPIADMLWQACGITGSPYFSASGEWVNPAS